MYRLPEEDIPTRLPSEVATTYQVESYIRQLFRECGWAIPASQIAHETSRTIERFNCVGVFPVNALWKLAAMVVPWSRRGGVPDPVGLAVLKDWETRYGAELRYLSFEEVGCVVNRPPVLIEDGYAAAEVVSLVSDGLLDWRGIPRLGIRYPLCVQAQYMCSFDRWIMQRTELGSGVVRYRNPYH